MLPEYMLAEKPIVASRVDAIPNIIRDGENGLLVRVDDVNDVYNAIMKYYKDPSMKELIVTCGLKDVKEKFNAVRVSEEHESLFKNMMEKNEI